MTSPSVIPVLWAPAPLGRTKIQWHKRGISWFSLALRDAAPLTTSHESSFQTLTLSISSWNSSLSQITSICIPYVLLHALPTVFSSLSFFFFPINDKIWIGEIFHHLFCQEFILACFSRQLNQNVYMEKWFFKCNGTKPRLYFTYFYKIKNSAPWTIPSGAGNTLGKAVVSAASAGPLQLYFSFIEKKNTVLSLFSFLLIN